MKHVLILSITTVLFLFGFAIGRLTSNTEIPEKQENIWPPTFDKNGKADKRYYMNENYEMRPYENIQEVYSFLPNIGYRTPGDTIIVKNGSGRSLNTYVFGWHDELVFISNDKYPEAQPLSGNIGKYTIDLPEEISQSQGKDLLVKKIGDSIIIYFNKQHALKGDYDSSEKEKALISGYVIQTFEDGSFNVVGEIER